VRVRVRVLDVCACVRLRVCAVRIGPHGGPFRRFRQLNGG